MRDGARDKKDHVTFKTTAAALSLRARETVGSGGDCGNLDSAHLNEALKL